MKVKGSLKSCFEFRETKRDKTIKFNLSSWIKDSTVRFGKAQMVLDDYMLVINQCYLPYFDGYVIDKQEKKTSTVGNKH